MQFCKPALQTVATRRWKRIVAEAGIPHARNHDLRGTFCNHPATVMVAAMKTKQNAAASYADKLHAAIDALAKHYGK